uniref:BRCT domain-containing protein n=1 Tax=Hucho hucho TaxID=62062 RepID=A0A4W5QGD5_9TELE
MNIGNRVPFGTQQWTLTRLYISSGNCESAVFICNLSLYLSSSDPALPPVLRPTAALSCSASDSQEDDDFVVAETQSFVLEAQNQGHQSSLPVEPTLDVTQPYSLEPSLGEDREEQHSRGSFQLDLSDSSHLQTRDKASESTQAFSFPGGDSDLEATQTYGSGGGSEEPGLGQRSAVFDRNRQVDFAVEATQAYAAQPRSDTEEEDEEETQPLEFPTPSNVATTETLPMSAYEEEDGEEEEDLVGAKPPTPVRRGRSGGAREREEQETQTGEVLTNQYLSTAQTLDMVQESDDEEEAKPDSPRRRGRSQEQTVEEEETQTVGSYLSTAETQPMFTTAAEDDDDDDDNEEKELKPPSPRRRGRSRRGRVEEEETQPSEFLTSSHISTAETQLMGTCDTEEEKEEDTKAKGLAQRGRGKESEAGTSGVSSRGRRGGEEESSEPLKTQMKGKAVNTARGEGRRGKLLPEEQESEKEEEEVEVVERGRRGRGRNRVKQQKEGEKERLEKERREEEEGIEKERQEQAEKEQLQKEKVESEKVMKEQQDRVRMEQELKEQQDRVRMEQELKEQDERESVEREETERMEREKREQKERERLERERKEREEQERLERERKEREEQERLERERKEREEQERLERERKEREEQERLECERAKREKERLEKEEKERIERERKRLEREEKEKQEKLERESREKEALERLERERVEREEKERIEGEQAEKERLGKERKEILEKEKMEREEKKKQERERLKKKKEEKERLDREMKERNLKEKLEREKKEREKREAEEKEKEIKERQAKEQGEKQAKKDNENEPKTSTRGRRATPRRTFTVPPTTEPQPELDILSSQSEPVPASITRSRSNSSNSVSSERSSIGTQGSRGRGGRKTTSTTEPAPGPDNPTRNSTRRRTLVGTVVTPPAAVEVTVQDILSSEQFVARRTCTRSISTNSHSSTNSEVSTFIVASVSSQSKGRGGGRRRKTGTESLSPSNRQSEQPPAPKPTARGRRSQKVEDDGPHPEMNEKADYQEAGGTTRGQKKTAKANEPDPVAADEETTPAQVTEDSPAPRGNGRGRGRGGQKDNTPESTTTTAGGDTPREEGVESKTGGRGKGRKRGLEEEEEESSGFKVPQGKAKVQRGGRCKAAEEKEENPASTPAKKGRASTAQVKKIGEEEKSMEGQSEKMEEACTVQRKARGRQSIVQIKKEEESVLDSNSVTPTGNGRGKRSAPVESSPLAKTTRSSSASPLSSLSSPGTLGRARAATQSYKVLFTGVVDEEGGKVVSRLGGSLAKGVADMTHLVTDRVRRTVKFLCAVARGVPVVTTDWLDKCGKVGSFLPTDRYLVKDREQENKLSFCLEESLRTASTQPLLQGYEVHVTRSVLPEPAQMKDIIVCSGAHFLSKMPSTQKAQARTLVISCGEDWSLCAPALSASLPVLSAEFLLTGILQQRVDLVTHVLSAPKPSAQPGGKGQARKRM